MPRARDSPPRLTDAVVAKATDGILRRGYLRLLASRIRQHQDALRRVLSDEAWNAYLRLEEVSSERLDAAMVRAARWGYRLGSRRRTAPRRGI